VNLLRLTRVEMRRALHRRLVRWMIVLAIVLSVVAGIASFLSSASKLSPDHPARMSQWWLPGTGDGFLSVAAIFLMIGTAICAASVAGAEWKAGTMTTVLTWEPSRWRLHAARTASAAILTFLISFGLQIVFLAADTPAVLAHGSTTVRDGFWSALVLAMLRISLMAALIAVLAVSIATLGRNTSAALIAIAGWGLIVERVIAGLRPQWARFMISENVATVVPWAELRNAEFHRPPAFALATLLVYCAAISLASAWTFGTRDVATA
jgi:hypothetical protein